MPGLTPRRSTALATWLLCGAALASEGEGRVRVQYPVYPPAPANPQRIAWRRTRAPALALSRPLERNRSVDETGHQIAVVGRIGARPFTLEEQQLYLDGERVWTVSDAVEPGARARARARAMRYRGASGRFGAVARPRPRR